MFPHGSSPARKTFLSILLAECMATLGHTMWDFPSQPACFASRHLPLRETRLGLVKLFPPRGFSFDLNLLLIKLSKEIDFGWIVEDY